MSRLAIMRRGVAKAGTGGKGKGKGGFFAKWTPPGFEKLSKSMTPAESRTETQAAEPIILVPGEYEDLYTLHPSTGLPEVGQFYHHHAHRYQRHFQGRPSGYRSCTCTTGPDQHSPQPCVPCLLIDQKQLDEKSSGSRSSWVVNGFHLTSYYETQYVKDGQAQTRDDGTAIMVKKECKQGTIAQRNYWEYRASKSQGKESAQCDGCVQGIPHVLGNHRYWELGKGHLNALLTFNEKELAGICYYTGTGIVKKGFACSSCLAPILDIAVSQFTNEQIQQYEDAPQTCSHCAAVDLPIPDYESGYDTKFIAKIADYQHPVDPTTNQPVKLRPLDLFDVVLWIQREGEGTKSVPVIKKWERLTQAPFGDDGAPFDLTDTLKDGVTQVFDFADLFSTNPDQQAKDLDRPNPYAQQQYQDPPPNQGGYTQPPPQPPQPGYSPAADQPPVAAAPAVAPNPPGTPAAAPAAAPAVAPAAAPAATPEVPPATPATPPAAPGVPISAPTAGPQAAPPAAPQIAAVYPQPPQVSTAPAGPPQPGNRPDWNG